MLAVGEMARSGAQSEPLLILMEAVEVMLRSSATTFASTFRQKDTSSSSNRGQFCTHESRAEGPPHAATPYQQTKRKPRKPLTAGMPFTAGLTLRMDWMTSTVTRLEPSISSCSSSRECFASAATQEV